MKNVSMKDRMGKMRRRTDQTSEKVREATMAHRGEKGFAGKHPEDHRVDPGVLKAVKDRAREGELPCAVAFAIAKELGVSPKDVGVAADTMEIRLIRCQLGLFGHRPVKRLVKPLERVPPEMEKEIREGLQGTRLPCERAWAISKRLQVPKMEVSSACEALGIKIGPCQLGAF